MAFICSYVDCIIGDNLIEEFYAISHIKNIGENS